MTALKEKEYNPMSLNQSPLKKNVSGVKTEQILSSKVCQFSTIWVYFNLLHGGIVTLWCFPSLESEIAKTY